MSGRLGRWLLGVGTRLPVVPVVLAVVLQSTGPVLVQASHATGTVFSLWRLWFGVGVLGAAYALHRRVTGETLGRDGWRWSTSAGAAFSVHQVLLFVAIKATTVADVTLVNSVAPVVTAVLAFLWLRERTGSAFKLWSLVAMAGTATVVLGATTSPEGDPLGMLLALGNVVAFSVFLLASRGSRSTTSVIPFLFGVTLVAAVLVSAYAVVAGEPIREVTSRDLLLALLVAAGPGALGHFVMTWPLRMLPANLPPVLSLGLPVLAAIWAAVFLGEPITFWHLVGGTLTVVGVAGAVLARARGTGVGDDRAARPTDRPT